MVSTHFPPYHLGGDAVYVEYLSRELVKMGHEVHVLHNPSVYETIRRVGDSEMDDVVEDGLHRHAFKHRLPRFDTINSLLFGSQTKGVNRAADLAREVRPDVVHWHNTRGFIGVPVVLGGETALYTSHDYGSVCPRSNLLRPNLQECERARLCTICCTRWLKPPQLWRIGSKRVLEYPQRMRIIAPSEFLAKRLRSEGVRVAHVLRNFVPDPSSQDREVDLQDDTIVYLGMLEIHKGLRTLVRAFEKSVADQGFILDIIGNGTLRHEVEQMASRTGVKGRVRVHGFLKREEAERLRRRAVAQIVPSEWYENCPLTILEAFAWGVPVVGSDSGGIPEIVGPESGSRLFKTRDVDALANVLVDIWSERGRISAMREKARSTYESRFRPETHMMEYIKIVNS
jgi:glycosyltransferase involved in cell wall biosynthesis